MFPLAQATPKPLLKVAGKSLLHWIIEGLRRAGISKVYVVVGYKGDMVREELEAIGRDVGLSVEAVEQGSRPGTGAALQAVSFLSEPFLVSMGDAALDWMVYKDLMEFFQEAGEDTVVVKRVEDPTRYGVVELEGGRIKRIVEKPRVAFSKLVNVGIYAFTPSIFEKLRHLKPSPRGEYEITDVLAGMRAMKTERFLIDVGYPWGLLEALRFYLQGHSIIKGEVEGVVKGPVYIDGDSYVAPMSVVGPYVQLTASHVGPHSYVRDAILFGSNLEGHNTLAHSVLHTSLLRPRVAVEWKAEKEVVVDTGERLILTNRRELGAVAYSSEVGTGSVLKPGTVLNRARVGELKVVRGYVGE